ncbi:hypothetical protein G7Y89_g7774 [Cudoniella acicularis]|uniref:Uncharacterized protein n=1 Tax=Cudoniella acicularis TaxID=354080 RepID=A0A8H4W180_9HELO|nr:hypothetical protein G7Y89_g7774 [Cudoniella acicularis]
MTYHDSYTCASCFDSIAGVPINVPVIKNNTPPPSPQSESPSPSSPDSPNSNQTTGQYPLWKADIMVYLAGKGLVHSQEREDFASEEQMRLHNEDRKRKAMIWFMVSENLRREHLLDLCGRDKTSEDVWRRLCERVGGGKQVPLPPLQL